MSYDSVAVLKSFADRRHITFPLLSDPESKIIRAFGILNETVKPGTPQFGIPYPGTFIVDAKGTVVSKYFEEDFRERVSAGSSRKAPPRRRTPSNTRPRANCT